RARPLVPRGEMRMDPRLRWLAASAVAAAALAALVLLASGPGARAGLWPPRAAIGALRWSALLALLGAVLSVVTLVVARLVGGAGGAAGAAGAGGGAGGAGAAASGGGPAGALVAGALLVSLLVFVVPWRMAQQARGLPWIHDISTDLAEPPA